MLCNSIKYLTFCSVFSLPVLVGCASQPSSIHLGYDEQDGTTYTTDLSSGQRYEIANAYDYAERVPGIEGSALRLDGYSTWVEAEASFDGLSEMTVETWAILESLPSDREVPYGQLQPSAFVSQLDESGGFALQINTYGQWSFVVYLDGEKHQVEIKEPFPVYKWTHVAAVLDAPRSSIKLYLDGELVKEQKIDAQSRITGSDSTVYIGKSSFDRYLDVFLVNALNGAFDETRILPEALSAEAIANRHSQYQQVAADLMFESIAVSPHRFADDLQRPMFHSMPPANWTNEPHGLVQVDGKYHMYYQRTPNGPFKTKMHWGHLYSEDLVGWENRRDALWPTLEDSDNYGYDMKGIWSGDVVYHEGKGYAFYTSANYDGPIQHSPMISLAISEDDNLEFWDKKGPIIDARDLEDYRDPYIFREGDWWYMIIGAKIDGVGSVDFYRSGDLLSWERQPRFTAVPFADMDIQSDVWEMPVFERLSDDKYVLVVNPVGNKVTKYDEERPTRPIYWTGKFKDGQFHPDYLQGKNLDIIFGHLSPSVTRTSEGELVGIGIVDERRSQQAQLDAGWAHTFSLPRQWKLMDDTETLGQEPISALEQLRRDDSYLALSDVQVDGLHALSGSSRQRELMIEVDTDKAADRYGLELGVSADRSEYTRLVYDTRTQTFTLDKTHSSLSDEVEDKAEFVGEYDVSAFGEPERFHVYIDGSVIDIFINNSAALSFRIYPQQEGSDQVNLVSEGGTTGFSRVESWMLEAP